MTWRPINDETLIHPKRGRGVPVPPEGYTAKEGDPYVAVVTIPKCKYRDKEEAPKSSSCCASAKIKCNLFEETVKRITCHECDSAEK
jgi:hypothetical protein